MGFVIWASIIGASAVAIAFLCYCFRCVTRELRREDSCPATLICVAKPKQRQSKVIEISKTPQTRAERRKAQ